MAPQIARVDLFGDPARYGALLAPRGDRIAFLAPRDGVTNLWVVSIGAMDDARPVTDDRGLGVRSFAWAHDNTTLIYALEEGANGATRLYAIDTAAADAAKPAEGAAPAEGAKPEGAKPAEGAPLPTPPAPDAKKPAEPGKAP